eukprot:CAMPEP_0198151092 /NCGR_PEP_ID=MMETSP1443-20131203/54190_1 /TAXON_ID=186043 /ORGANISM="Entomoneis sp., Strain CCMP2396" /LENGTH=564 /DNA_ID=CAMNT_0043816649 /DNA_START=62 /DNA_END=1756 /DNA_ORIENTATION=-
MTCKTTMSMVQAPLLLLLLLLLPPEIQAFMVVVIPVVTPNSLRPHSCRHHHHSKWRHNNNNNNKNPSFLYFPGPHHHLHWRTTTGATTKLAAAYLLTSALEESFSDFSSIKNNDHVDDDDDTDNNNGNENDDISAFPMTSSLLNWMDLTTPQTTQSSHSFETTNNGELVVETLPLYPLPAVFLPDPSVNHTLRNIEPRNIQMALDLELQQVEQQQLQVERRFCVVMQAVDTGRIATVGTIFKVLHMEKQWRSDADATATNAARQSQGQVQSPYQSERQKLKRIILTCQAVDVVDILRVENPEAASAEQRIKRSSEYLRAKVQYRTSNDGNDSNRKNLGDNENDNQLLHQTCQEALHEYKQVQQLYLTFEGGGHENTMVAAFGLLPPFARQQLSKVFSDNIVDIDTFLDPVQFWKVANSWQMLCNTVREGRQRELASNRDELLVSAAMSGSGKPLKLPVHVEDVSPDVRRQVSQMEYKAHREWLLMTKLDPCLDFQILLTFQQEQQQQHRVQHLTHMFRRERKRLEKILLLQQKNASAASAVLLQETSPSLSEQRKGAWFDNSRW